MIEACVEPMISLSDAGICYQIVFKANNKVIGRGLIDFNDRNTAENYLKEITSAPQANEP